jgi:hypothetical protein
MLFALSFKMLDIWHPVSPLLARAAWMSSHYFLTPYEGDIAPQEMVRRKDVLLQHRSEICDKCT